MKKVVGAVSLAMLATCGILYLGDQSARNTSAQAQMAAGSSESGTSSGVKAGTNSRCNALPTLVSRTIGPGAAAVAGRGESMASRYYRVEDEMCVTEVYAPDAQLGPVIGIVDSQTKIQSLGCVASGGRMSLTFIQPGNPKMVTGDVYTDDLTFEQVELPEICQA